MGKVYVILGKSGSGKSTIESSLALIGDETLNVSKTISTTSRPMRENEIDGIDYYFISKEDFMKRIKEGEFCEHSFFNGWFYGTSIKMNDIDLSRRNYVMVLNPSGFRQVLDTFGEGNVIGIYLTCDDKIRIVRSLYREEHPDCREICRRFVADEEDFAGIEDIVKYTINTTSASKEDVVMRVINIIKSN